MRNICISVLGLLLILSCWAAAQELVYDEPIKVGYDAVECYTPLVIFNGTGHGVFFYWSGVGDKDQGLHFRRLDENAQPVGPQKILLALDQDYGFVAGAWDGEAYVVSYTTHRSNKVYLLRVSPTGKILAQQTMTKERNLRLYILRVFVIGEKVFLFYDKERKKGLYLYDSYMAQVDRKLEESIVTKQLPAGDLKNSFFCGVTHDADKFLLMLGEYGTGYWSGYKITKVRLLQVDFTGKVIKKPYSVPVVQDIIEQTSWPAGGVLDSFVDCWDAYGPIYVGDGFNIVVVRSPEPFPDGSGLPYNHQSIKIDEDGNLILGPFNLGGQYYIFSAGRLVGNHVGYWVWNVGTSLSSYIILIGKAGPHIGNSYYGEAHDSVDMVWVGTHAYTGTVNTIAYVLLKGWWFGGSEKIYANQYRMPQFSKPSFFYFKAGTAEPVENRRLVMWSVVLGKNVTLKGPDFEMKDLPPVWSYLVDTKGQKTKLTLSFTTEDGQKKKKRLVINP